MFIPRPLEILSSDWLVAVDCFLFTGHCKTTKKGQSLCIFIYFFLQVHVFYDKLIKSLGKKMSKKA